MLSIPVIREKVLPVLEKYPVRRAYLFGSYARGDATEKSDVDIRIELMKQNFFVVCGIYADLEDSLGMDFDLLSSLPDSERFRENLKRDEVLIYEREGQADRGASDTLCEGNRGSDRPL